MTENKTQGALDYLSKSLVSYLSAFRLELGEDAYMKTLDKAAEIFESYESNPYMVKLSEKLQEEALHNA